MINILIEFESKLLDIDAESLPIRVEFVSKVLETGSDDVFVDWEQSVLDCRVFDRMECDRGRFSGIFCDGMVALLIVEDEEVLKGLLNSQLSLSLD